MNYTIEEIKNWLKSNLNEERYQHSIGTAECARELAEKYGIDTDKAYLAGLLHDCAKCFSKEKTSNILKCCDDLDEAEICSPKTHHAPVGSHIVKNEFNICDNEILSSIRWHTIGKPNMNLFEKIIFLSDKIEKRTRSKEIAEPIRALLNQENGLNKAILECYKNTIKSLVDRNMTICTSTIKIYNDLLKNI